MFNHKLKIACFIVSAMAFGHIAFAADCAKDDVSCEKLKTAMEKAGVKPFVIEKEKTKAPENTYKPFTIPKPKQSGISEEKATGAQEQEGQKEAQTEEQSTQPKKSTGLNIFAPQQQKATTKKPEFKFTEPDSPLVPHKEETQQSSIQYH